tara:strand:+ start:50467 stop:51354 length:888 start_codon:yes stop_codon:yes gene_type:complete
MTLYTLPKKFHPDFREPFRKPTGPVQVDWSHPFVSGAESVLLFNKISKVPIDETGLNWVADTAQDTTPFQHEVVNRNLAFARQDTGDTTGICYKSDIIGDWGTSTPYYAMVIHTLIHTPAAANLAIWQIADGIRDGSPQVLQNTRSSTTLGVYVGGNYRFTGIPTIPFEKHVTLIRFDGNNTYDFYDSAVGTWSVFSGGGTAKTSLRFWIGTGYFRELPCAFELFVAGSGSGIPSLAECKERVKDPYAFLEPATPAVYLTQAVAAGPGRIMSSLANGGGLAGLGGIAGAGGGLAG